MLSGTARRPGTPRVFRVMLITFLVRHVLSVGLFAYITVMAFHVPGPMRYLMGLITLVFVGFAVFQGNKLLGQYRRSMARAAQPPDVGLNVNNGKRR